MAAVETSFGRIGQTDMSAIPGSSSPPMSPTSRLHAAHTQESVSGSKLFRDLSPTRVFVGSSRDEVRASLPNLFKQKNGLQSLRPVHMADGAWQQEEANKAPKLLQRLEYLLGEKLSVVERLGNGSKGFAALQLRTDAFRQVFDAFLHSFTTYRSLLMRIKAEYDVALDDALSSLYDNVHMKAELDMFHERLETAIKDSKKKAVEDTSVLRRELQDQLEQQEHHAQQVELKCQATEQDIARCRSSIAALRKEAAQLLRHNKSLKHQMVAQSTWNTPGLLASYEAAEGDEALEAAPAPEQGATKPETPKAGTPPSKPR